MPGQRLQPDLPLGPLGASIQSWMAPERRNAVVAVTLPDSPAEASLATQSTQRGSPDPAARAVVPTPTAGKLSVLLRDPDGSPQLEGSAVGQRARRAAALALKQARKAASFSGSGQPGSGKSRSSSAVLVDAVAAASERGGSLQGAGMLTLVAGAATLYARCFYVPTIQGGVSKPWALHAAEIRTHRHWTKLHAMCRGAGSRG
jgi:hypothetical protein